MKLLFNLHYFFNGQNTRTYQLLMSLRYQSQIIA